MRITVVNRGPEPAPLHVLPTLWFRNTWAWERTTESYWPRPELLMRRPVRARPARLAGAVSLRASDPRVRRPAARASVLRQRDQRGAALRRAVAEPLAEGRHPRGGGERPARRGEPGSLRHQGRGALPAGASAGRLGQPASEAGGGGARAGAGRRRHGGRALRQPSRRGRRVLRAAASGGVHRRGAARRTAGLGRAPLVQAVLPLQRRRVAPGRSCRSDAASGAEAGPQRRLGGEPLQPRRPLHARQLGVPVVRGVGPRLPHAAVLRGGSDLREGAARPAPARMVHAPQRPPAGVRVGVLGRQPARARLGLLAGLQEDGAAGPARRRVPQARLPQAAAQLHLVGEPEGSRREEPLLRRLPRAGQRRGVRPEQAAAHRRSPHPGRRHGVDGLLLHHHAQHRARAGADGRGVRGHRQQVLRALRGHRRRDQRARRPGAVGREGRLLLRPSGPRRPEHPAAAAEPGGAHPALRRRGARRPRGGPAPRVQQADALVPREPARARSARLLPAAASTGRPARGSWPSPPASGWCALLGYVLDENEFLSPYGVRSLSRVHAAHPYQLSGYADLDGALRPGRLHQRHLRGKLQLARVRCGSP